MFVSSSLQWLLLSMFPLFTQSFVGLGALRSGRVMNHRRFVAVVAPDYKMPPADLTPAVDKFARLPSEGMLPGDLKAQGVAPSCSDPFKMVASELQPLSDYVKELVVSENPVLTKAASHFFNSRQGKRFRPTIVALVGMALQPDGIATSVRTRQLQLGQITEMIHTASLIHDDVLDEAVMRRGGDAVHTMYTDKVAVLAGDYLMARASVLLARLQHLQVVEVMASALDSLVQGEIMQARSTKADLTDFDQYLRKSYFKTASLICNSCKSAALLAGYEEQDLMTVSVEEFGYHLGMAYQIVDDILDFTGASASLGKPAQADMELGLATAPILFASQRHKELIPLIERRFKNAGDVQTAVSIAAGTDSVAESYGLAEFHANKALEAIRRLPESDARDSLVGLLHIVLSRSS
jgi:geranylgeranyl pyrophosphate synthase